MKRDSMTKITGIDYLKMSKYDLYKEYCKTYNELENTRSEYVMRLNRELYDAKMNVMRLKMELYYAKFMGE